MRMTLRSEALPLAFVAASWLLLALFWPHLPERLPVHWGLAGTPDRWAPRWPGALIGPGVATLTYGLLTLVPAIDPRRAHWQAAEHVYPVLKGALAGFFALVTYLALSAAVRPDAELSRTAVFAGMGVLFMVLGNYLPKVRSNWFVGVRTPWTLSSEEVWYRTHRLTGKLMVGAGLLMALSGLLPVPWQIGVGMAALAAIVVVPIGYSYWLFRRLASPEGPAA
jgi:uncharacterized membrane protein